MTYPKLRSYEDAALYIKRTPPIRGRSVVPLRRDRTKPDIYNIRHIHGGIAAKMYHTDIIVWMEDGRIIISDYNSRTTIKVQNELLWNCHLYQRLGYKHLCGIGSFYNDIIIRIGENGRPVAEPEGLAYFYGLGRKFLDADIRALYAALKSYIAVAVKIKPDFLSEFCMQLGRLTSNCIEENITFIKWVMNRHGWTPGHPLSAELVEDCLYYGTRKDPLHLFKAARMEYKGTTRESEKWNPVSYSMHQKNQAFLHAPIDCSIIEVLK